MRRLLATGPWACFVCLLACATARAEEPRETALAPYGPVLPAAVSGERPADVATGAVGEPPQDLSGWAPLKPVADGLKALNRDGVHLRAQLVEEPAVNTTGGASQGFTRAGQFQFGGDFDLEKLFGARGASFHVTVFKDSGYSLATDRVGVDYALQEIYKNPYERLHFGVFAYEQRFLDDRFDLVLGRLGTTTYFAHLPELCNFLNGAVCGIPTILKIQSGLVLPPSSTWGGRLLYRSTPHLSFSLGANEVNPTASASNGLHWGLEHATGYSVEFETAYQKALAETPHPYTIKVGGVHSNAPHADPYYNVRGQSLALYGGPGMQVRRPSRNTVYVTGDDTVWRSGAFPSSLALFGTYTKELESSEIYGSEVAGGFVWTGPFANRPIDKFAVEAFELELTPHERAFLHDARLKAGGSGWNAAHEYELEASYNYAILPGLRLMPSIQYIVHPDNSLQPHIGFVPHNALVLGLQLVVNIGGLLGVPSELVQ